MQKKVLYTGFGPFSNITSNPSSEAAEHLASFPGVKSLILPVSYARCFETLLPEIERFEPDVIILSGVAAGRKSISVERFAYNEKKASVPDNDGILYTGTPIHEGAPAVLETVLDTAAIEDALKNAGIPAYVSEDPGRYICNCIYFSTLLKTNIPAIFIHYPAESDMPLSDVLKAAEILVENV